MTWVVGCGTPHVAPLDAPSLPEDRAPPVTEVDLLLLVDDSSSMSEEQVLLLRELPAMVRALASGDLDDDGRSDVRGVTSLHVGVITPDLGAGPFAAVPTCAVGLGDDGILRDASRSVTPCGTTLPSNVLAFAPASDDEAEFVEALACVASTGTRGCGFEQQLEATLKALTPSAPRAWTRPGYVPPRFLDARGTNDAEEGQGERANAGFLRPDSVLAILVLTDEEDCSVSDYGLFASDDPRFAEVPLSRRCFAALEPPNQLVRGVERYVDGLLGLRRRSEDLVFAAIVGMPVETVPAAGEVADFEAILSHPDMIGYPPTGGGAVQACMSERGVAVAGRRFVELARGLSEAGAAVVLDSICRETYEAPRTSALRSIGARLEPL
jgi:hypothetical protein